MRLLSALLALAFALAPLSARAAPAVSSKGMVASAHPLATAAGVEALAEGGGAVDAAIATALVLAVAEPYSSGIGGGGFALVLPKPGAPVAALDFRERAPRFATRDMFVVEGKADPELSTVGALAAGVPGEIAGLWELHRRWGKLPWERLVAPAIRAAREGVLVDPAMAARLSLMREKLGRFSGSRAVFFRPDGKVLEEGDRLAQPNLAGTLERVAKEGPKGFYEGYVARRIAEEMDRQGGLVTEEDLRAYRVVERAPVEGRYRGRRIASFPPPSSGGVHVLQILGMLEGFDLAAAGPGSVRATHLLAEAMRRAFADRAKFLGDPDFVKVPVAGLLADPYLRARAASIRVESASASKDVGPGAPEGAPPESDHTTHLSVVDASGAAVAMTLTINGPFGSCLVASDTGVLLNNQMDDFSAQPGAPNLYGLVGGEANAVAPRKTPLSSMSPTLVFSKDGELELVVGSPGGPRIISTVAQAILNVLDRGLPLDEALAAPRAHHQWLPDKLLLEGKFPKETAEKLRALGHSVGRGGAWSNAQAVRVGAGGALEGASDPRGIGRAAGPE